MVPEPDLRSSARAGTRARRSHESLAVSFAAALAVPNVTLARAVVTGAAEAGASPGRLYLDVIRPALVRLTGDGPPAQGRLAAELAATVLADVLETRPHRADTASGRVAVVAYGDEGLHAADGHAATEFLEWGGWRVERLGLSPDAGRTDLARGGAIELAVLVVGATDEVSGLGKLCTALRHSSDPPVIVLADFGGRPRPRATLMALGADDAVLDPDALLRTAVDHSPAPGRRRWGVRLRRTGPTLTIVPTGTLDATNAGRLVDVAASRTGTYTRLVIDLRDLSDIGPDGVGGLAAWAAGVAADDVKRDLLVDPVVRGALHQAGIAGWRLIEPDAR